MPRYLIHYILLEFLWWKLGWLSIYMIMIILVLSGLWFWCWSSSTWEEAEGRRVPQLQDRSWPKKLFQIHVIKCQNHHRKWPQWKVLKTIIAVLIITWTRKMFWRDFPPWQSRACLWGRGRGYPARHCSLSTDNDDRDLGEESEKVQG